VGGCFNVKPEEVIQLIKHHPSTKKGTFRECHASGLLWTDKLLHSLVRPMRKHVIAISAGFSQLSSNGMLNALSCPMLERLALPFCDCLDNNLLAELGKRFDKLTVLDIRGSPVTSLTPFLDARACGGTDLLTEEGDDLPYFFLARYSGITSESLKETKTIYPFGFECIIDGGGLGGGVRRS